MIGLRCDFLEDIASKKSIKPGVCDRRESKRPLEADKTRLAVRAVDCQ